MLRLGRLRLHPDEQGSGQWEDQAEDSRVDWEDFDSLEGVLCNVFTGSGSVPGGDREREHDLRGRDEVPLIAAWLPSIDPNQKALATAAEHLGELLEQAANAHELEDAPRRDVWRQLEEAAIKVATYAALLAGEEEAD